ncbi:recombinase family protein [Vibrio scophthalmi]|uniref:recombinase family protein n=1 Tax=Vibrio scophthalmi TaxID=45658 RepID=UPI002284D864|nr:recombinase family protein [Vibrio scophthalmi]MCY9804372.1 recombinase family protein [Vibrio scophthalmi]
MFSFDKTKYKGIGVPYARFSTKAQSKVGKKSLERQLSEARRYAKQHDLFINEDLIFADKGVSGHALQGNVAKAFKKGQMQVMLALLDKVPEKERENIYIMFHNFDRFSRMSPDDAREYFNLILKRGFNIVTTIDNQLYTRHNKDLSRMLISSIKMTTAWQESEVKSVYIKDALKRKKDIITYLYTHPSQKGQWKHVGVVQPTMPSWIDHEKVELTYVDANGLSKIDTFKKFTLNEEKAKVVRYIFDLKIKGYGYNRISRILNEQQVPVFEPQKRKMFEKWYESAIRQIIIEEKAIGHLTLMGLEVEEYLCEEENIFKKRKIRKDYTEKLIDYYPAVVSEETFLKANEMIVKQNRPAKLGRIGERTNVFGNIAVCGCGSNLQYRRTVRKLKKKKTDLINEYLNCVNSHTNYKCECKTINYRLLEDAFFRYINHIDFEKVCNADSKNKLEEFDSIDNQIDQIESELKKVEKTNEGLIKTFEATVSQGIDGSFVVKQISENNKKKETLNDKLERLKLLQQTKKIELEDDGEEVTDTLSYLKTLKSSTMDEKIELRKKINDFLVTKIVWMEVVCLEREKYVIVAFTDNVIRTFSFDDRAASDLMFNTVKVSTDGLNSDQSKALLLKLIVGVKSALSGELGIISKIDLIDYIKSIKSDFSKNIK